VNGTIHFDDEPDAGCTEADSAARGYWRWAHNRQVIRRAGRPYARQGRLPTSHT
jgi:hypothetical protein